MSPFVAVAGCFTLCYATLLAVVLSAWRARVRMLGRHHEATRFPVWLVSILSLGIAAGTVAVVLMWWWW